MVGAELREPLLDRAHEELGLGLLPAPHRPLHRDHEERDQRDHDRHRDEELDHAEAAAARGRVEGSHQRPPETFSIMETSGMKSASTIVPTMPPRTTTISGSSRLRRPATATSTSSS
ncbi:MAG: hypothetical protein RJA16_1786 [Planctomycetota bacterium]